MIKNATRAPIKYQRAQSYEPRTDKARHYDHGMPTWCRERTLEIGVDNNYNRHTQTTFESIILTMMNITTYRKNEDIAVFNYVRA